MALRNSRQGFRRKFSGPQPSTPFTVREIAANIKRSGGMMSITGQISEEDVKNIESLRHKMSISFSENPKLPNIHMFSKLPALSRPLYEEVLGRMASRVTKFNIPMEAHFEKEKNQLMLRAHPGSSWKLSNLYKELREVLQENIHTIDNSIYESHEKWEARVPIATAAKPEDAKRLRTCIKDSLFLEEWKPLNSITHVVPPGRCHSCTRAKANIWTSGPPGPRTLCNARGLHYAKLSRRSQQQEAVEDSEPKIENESGDFDSLRKDASVGTQEHGVKYTSPG
ncbi:hypothetical protein B7494_g2041 [Chlorociboria aeruginascens]|nr:hypothetical protein B7494_g2041 [Chlorociboria aeruginascens]